MDVSLERGVVRCNRELRGGDDQFPRLDQLRAQFTDSISGDWGGKPYVDLMKGLDYVEKTYPFIDKNREAALGASYGGYMANWLLGHTDRFKCIVSHDGTFNTESTYGTTEELWFPEWEFKGPPWKNRELYRKFSPHFHRRCCISRTKVTGCSSRKTRGSGTKR